MFATDIIFILKHETLLMRKTKIHKYREQKLSASSNTSNHHKGRFDSTKAVSQRIPKVTIRID